MGRGAKRSQEQHDLENELRNMILSNVRISPEDSRATAPSPRGRGLGHQQQHVPRHSREVRDLQHGNSSVQGLTSIPSPAAQTEQQSSVHRRQLGASNVPHDHKRSGPGAHPNHFAPGPSSPSDAGPRAGYGSWRPGVVRQINSDAAQTQNARSELNSPSSPRTGLFSQARHQGGSAPRGPDMASFITQCEMLDRLAAEEIPQVEMGFEELREKEAFRSRLEIICQEALKTAFPDLKATLSLRAYGSIVSGFATSGSDMDLTLVWSGQTREDSAFKAQLPRVLESAILNAGHGGRLLGRTRVPIIKVCESPSVQLHAALMEERLKWEKLSDDEKYPELPAQQETVIAQNHGEHNSQANAESTEIGAQQPVQMDPDASRSGKPLATKQRVLMSDDPLTYLLELKDKKRTDEDDLQRYCTQFINARRFALPVSDVADQAYVEYFLEGLPASVADSVRASQSAVKAMPQHAHQSLFDQIFELAQPIVARLEKSRPKKEKPWLRERALGKLDYPKTGVGIQCDINFSNPLGMHNTELLRLYALCDPRVRPMVLFVKAWAKRRKINSAYMGTLSSYGYVLMVLHFLIDVAQPPVLPNLQHVFGANRRQEWCDGYNISFYRDEAHIRQMAGQRQWTQNTEPLGVLLRNFFHYYAAQGHQVIGRGFNWMRDVISIRTGSSMYGPGGLITKEHKGWTGAKTTQIDGREVRQRYLLAIEDPFELDHNVGRPVTHNGIVTIRDEFRRAWRILTAVGKGLQPEGGLLDEVPDPPATENATENAIEKNEQAAVAAAEAPVTVDMG